MSGWWVCVWRIEDFGVGKMHSSSTEKSTLLRLKGVGPKVIERLEQMGFSSLQQLADADSRDILAQGAELSGSSCWKNSPQAKDAVRHMLWAGQL